MMDLTTRLELGHFASVIPGRRNFDSTFSPGAPTTSQMPLLVLDGSKLQLQLTGGSFAVMTYQEAERTQREWPEEVTLGTLVWTPVVYWTISRSQRST